MKFRSRLSLTYLEDRANPSDLFGLDDPGLPPPPDGTPPGGVGPFDPGPGVGDGTPSGDLPPLGDGGSTEVPFPPFPI